MSAFSRTSAPAALPQPARDITLTPSNADALKECAYRVVHAPKQPDASGTLRRGTLIHDILRLDTQRYLAGLAQLSAEEVVIRGCSDEEYKRDPQFLELASSCVAGARRFLSDRGVVAMQPERYVRSAYRHVAGQPGLRIRFSGKIDLIARNARSGLTLLDYKTGHSIPGPLDLATRPSSFVYTYLGRCLYDQDPRVSAACTSEIEIVQLLPHLGISSSATLTPDEIQAGTALVREMVIAMDQERNTPTPGDYCAYCLIKDECPANPQLAEWELDPL